MPNWEASQLLETWVHKNANILSTGRTSNFKPPGMDEEAFGEIEEKLNAAEEKSGNLIERLSPISAEEKIYPTGKAREEEGGEGTGIEWNFQANWLSKVCGSKQVYQKIGEEEGGVTSYATVYFKSLWWPGAYHVA